MDFSSPRKRLITEPVLPMINVVFLLLIFFMMTTRIAPQAPFAVTPPRTALDTGAGAAPILFLSETGEVFFDGFSDGAALAAIAAQPLQDQPLTLRADANVAATEVAALLAKLSRLGVSRINLVGQNG